MPDANTSIWEVVSAAVVKVWPGALGALGSLMWQPAESTLASRGASTVVGFAAAITVGPMLSELLNVSSQRVDAGIVFLVGLVGMVFAGEAIGAMRSIDFGLIVSDALRKLFRIDRDPR